MRRLRQQIGSGLTVPIQAAFVVLVLVLALSAWVSLRQTAILNGSQERVAHTHRVIGALREVHEALVGAQAGARGFVITRDEPSLKQYEDARQCIGQSLDAFDALVDDNPVQIRAAAELRRSSLELEAWLARVVEAARVDGLDASTDLVRTREGQQRMDELTMLVEQIEAHEEALLDERIATSRGAFVTAQWTGILVGTMAVVLVGAVYVLVRRYDSLRERSARAAADSEQRFRVTLASIGDAVLVTDARLRLTFVNGATPSLTGVDPSMIGRQLEDVFRCVVESTGAARENPASRALREARVVRTGPDTAVRLDDGRMRPIEATAADIRGQEGESLGVVLVVRDMSVARQAERERQRVIERFRSLVLATSQIVWTADSNGWVSEDSPTWRQYTGQTYEQWHGDGWLDAVHPDDRERVREEWRTALATARPFEIEYRLITRSGRYRWSRARAVPVKNADGEVREWVGMNRDIQPRKEAEDAQRDASRRKDEFIALLAHELRNPLAPLRNGLALLRGAAGAERERALDTPARALERERALDMPARALERERALDMMDRQLRHMVRLIDDLLDVSRISQGRLELKSERLDVRRVLDQALETVHVAITAKQQTLAVERSEIPLWVDADPIRLAQVITNLLNNASKYSPPGARIWVRVEREGARVLLSVRDTGKGIVAELMPRIWDLFRQGPGDGGTPEGGLGIGLTLVKRLVEMHGGTVEAFSEGDGCGSEFVVRLPASQSRPAPAPRSAPLAPTAPAALRVLVIDDNEDSAESLAMLLRVGGHDARVAYRGADALAIAATFQPQLVLCDIRMPDMSGYDVARRLREMAGERCALLVALTGYGAASDRELSAAAGFDHHLVKPVEPALLREMIARAGDPALRES